MLQRGLGCSAAPGNAPALVAAGMGVGVSDRSQPRPHQKDGHCGKAGAFLTDPGTFEVLMLDQAGDGTRVYTREGNCRGETTLRSPT